MANSLQVTAAKIIQYLSQIHGESSGLKNDGPSFAFHHLHNSTDLLERRTSLFKSFLMSTIQTYVPKEDGWIFDVACGSGLDSAFLVTAGYNVLSCDYSQHMVSLAREFKETQLADGNDIFSNWEIFKADWLTMLDDMRSAQGGTDFPAEYDCILCIGNSFPLMLIEEDCKTAMCNFARLTKVGEILVIDHRNNLPMMERGVVNKHGHNPYIYDQYNGTDDCRPFVVYGPDKIPLLNLLHFNLSDGTSINYANRPYTSETMARLVKEAFGETCSIQVFYDLQPESEHSQPIDTCWVTYIIQKNS